MKKTKNLVGIIAVIVFALSFFGCDPEVDVHEHTYASGWTKDAEYHWHAATCGHNLIEGKEAHTFGDWTVDTQPTEETVGEKSKTCSVCEYKVTEEIAKLDHTHALGLKHEAVAGTCQHVGTIEYYDCIKSTCDAKLDENLNVLASIDGTMGTHVKGTYHPAVVAADCKSNGVVEYWNCANEGCSKKLDADNNVVVFTSVKNGPHIKGSHYAAKAGTCLKNGTVEYWVCSKCSTYIDADGNKLSSIGTTKDPSNHASSETTWTITDTTHKETYNCPGSF